MVRWRTRWTLLVLVALIGIAVAAEEPRQASIPLPGGGGGAQPSGGGGGGTQPSEPANNPPPAQSNPPPTTPSTPAPNQPTPSANQPASTPEQQPSNTPPPNQPTSATQPAQQPSDTNPVIVTSGTGTEVVTVPASAPATSAGASGAASSSAAPSSTPESKGLGTGSIIGLSVAGGIAVLGIVGFFVWKFTRKRFNDFDDNEAIKWPELNAHGGGSDLDSHALPVRDTGRAGFGDDNDSQFDVSSRAASAAGFSSTNDFHSDPYAVPPLPHMNPNQPYRDDPTGAGAMYDPYRGPVPHSLEGGPAGEAFPMTQMRAVSPGPHAGMRSVSPGPNAAMYGGGGAGQYAPERVASPMSQQPGQPFDYGGVR